MSNIYYIYGAVFVVLTLLALLLMYLNKGGSSAGRLEQARINGILSSAALAKSRQDWSQALFLYEQAIGVIDGEKETDEALLIGALQSAAECYEKLAKFTEAKQQRTRLISIFESALNNSRIDFLTDIDYLCSTADFGNSTVDVANFYEKLLAFREKTLAPTDSDFINTIVIYSRLMRKLGEKEIADDLEAHAEQLRSGGSAKINVNATRNLKVGLDSAAGLDSGVDIGATSAELPRFDERPVLDIRTVPRLVDDENLDDLKELTDLDRHDKPSGG